MVSLNKVLLLGHLTREVTLRYTPTGTAVATFGLATNHRFRQGEALKDEPCFVDVVAFGRQAETVAAYLQKGAPALVEGRLRWRSWETDDGQHRTKHEVLADRVQFLGRPPAGTAAAQEAGVPADTPADEADDIPC